jgi:hypothetical protein
MFQHSIRLGVCFGALLFIGCERSPLAPEPSPVPSPSYSLESAGVISASPYHLEIIDDGETTITIRQSTIRGGSYP